MVQKITNKGDKEAKRVELGIETVSEMGIKGNVEKNILTNYKADRDGLSGENRC
jgi:hypothetical protein